MSRGDRGKIVLVLKGIVMEGLTMRKERDPRKRKRMLEEVFQNTNLG